MVYTDSEICVINQKWLTDGLARPGKTRQGLADYCGVSKQSVHKWINGTKATARAKGLKPGKISKINIIKASEYLECGLPSWMTAHAVREPRAAYDIKHDRDQNASSRSRFPDGIIELLESLPEDDLDMIIKFAKRLSSRRI